MGNRREFLLPALGLWALTAASLTAAPATQLARPATAPSAPHGNDTIDRGPMFDRVLPEVVFNGVGLDDAIDFLRDVSGAAFDVNWEALQAAGVKKDAAVTLKLSNVKFPRALQLVLESVGGKQARLHASVEDGRVLVTTWDDYVAHYTVEREYDVRDLLAPADAGHKAMPGDDLVGLIQDSIAPASWVSAGGKPGVIKEKEGRLTVTQTRENHRLIEDLIGQVRRRRTAAATQPAAPRPGTRSAR
jgi:hypothetical protein